MQYRYKNKGEKNQRNHYKYHFKKDACKYFEGIEKERAGKPASEQEKIKWSFASNSRRCS